MQYRLKEEYKGIIVSRNNPIIGKVTFNSNTCKPEDYKTYFKLGFEELFEERVEKVIDVIIDKIEDVVEDVVEHVHNKRKKRRL